MKFFSRFVKSTVVSKDVFFRPNCRRYPWISTEALWLSDPDSENSSGGAHRTITDGPDPGRNQREGGPGTANDKCRQQKINRNIYKNIYHVNLVQELELIWLFIYCRLLVELTVRSILEYVTKSSALNCILGICLPIPRVCTSLALLCAPSPLVVYAATETEYKVSAFRPANISSCAGKRITAPSNTANSFL